MNVHGFPSAVYHCNLPIKSPSVVYESSNGRTPSEPQDPPIPAWPDIEDPGLWCCLPTLKRAIFMDGVTLDTGNLLNGHEHLLEQLSTPNRSDGEFLHMTKRLNGALAEARGARDAFSLQHEVGHQVVGHMGVYSALQQSTLSDTVHSLLKTISTAPQPSPRELQYLWKEFFIANRRLCRLVQKYELVEETVATIYSTLQIAPEVFNSIQDELVQALVQKDPDSFHIKFSNYVFQDRGGLMLALSRLFALMEVFTIFLNTNPFLQRKRLTMSQNLARSIAALDDVLDNIASSSDPILSLYNVDQWLISNSPYLKPWLSMVIEFRLKPEKHPQVYLRTWNNSIILRFQATPTEIFSDTSVSESIREPIIEKAFWESMRQQISKVCGLTCPNKHADAPCCGKQDFICNLWHRLPKQYRAVFTPPTCSRGA